VQKKWRETGHFFAENKNEKVSQEEIQSFGHKKCTSMKLTPEKDLKIVEFS
jgi:hypothetical protein